MTFHKMQLLMIFVLRAELRSGTPPCALRLPVLLDICPNTGDSLFGFILLELDDLHWNSVIDTTAADISTAMDISFSDRHYSCC